MRFGARLIHEPMKKHLPGRSRGIDSPFCDSKVIRVLRYKLLPICRGSPQLGVEERTDSLG